jgi:hypothetical protein
MDLSSENSAFHEFELILKDEMVAESDQPPEFNGREMEFKLEPLPFELPSDALIERVYVEGCTTTPTTTTSQELATVFLGAENSAVAAAAVREEPPPVDPLDTETVDALLKAAATVNIENGKKDAFHCSLVSSSKSKGCVNF